MCKFNPKNDGRRIDPCMEKIIGDLKFVMITPIKTISCCCGHGKYPMTIILDNEGYIWDLVSGIRILRKKKFYKKDKQGYYYIPEVIKNE